MDRCSQIEWVLAYPFHHSIELDAEGNIWSPIRIEPAAFDPAIYDSMSDDGLAKVSPDGKLLYTRSVARVLVNAGYQALLFGAGAYDTDPIHLNEIYPALYSSRRWQRGDLLLSLRHRSTVFLYRPSEDKVLWLKTGPWLNQHDAKFVGDSRISVFGNDVMRSRLDNIFIRGHSTVYVYDMDTNKVILPYDKLFVDIHLESGTEGRSDILSNGDVFVEETVAGRLFRASAKEIRWSYINREAASDNIGILNWSRYLPASQMEPILPKLRCSR
jgi:hypothetical protein